MLTMANTTDDRRLEFPGQDETLTFLETSGDSRGARTLFEVALEPGAGTPPHRHRTYAESFEVLHGVLTLHRGEEVLRLEPGEAATVEAGVRHRFVNETDARVCFRCEIAPGQPGFERMQQVGFGLIADGRVSAKGMPKDPRHVALALVWSDTRLAGPAALAEPLIRLLALHARRTGEERRLIERYVRW